eukprot:5734472-Prymnesium_polylepis.1
MVGNPDSFCGDNQHATATFPNSRPFLNDWGGMIEHMRRGTVALSLDGVPQNTTISNHTP